MAREKRRVMGLLAAWHGAFIVSRMPFTAEVVDPNALNPFGEHPPETAEMKRLKEWQAKTRWRMTFTAPKRKG